MSITALSGSGDVASRSPAAAEAAVTAAKQALATDEFNVQIDQRNHSPSCVACDQKLADAAAQQLAQAQNQAQSQAQAAGGIDITV